MSQKTICGRTDAKYMPDKLRQKCRHTLRICNTNRRFSTRNAKWKALSYMCFARLV